MNMSGFSYRLIFIVNALVVFLFGAAFLILPTYAIDQFGVDNYASTKMVTQFFGTAMLALGLLLWFAKDVTDEAVQKGMSIALMAGSLAGLIVALIGTTGGTLRANGWIAILIYLLFGLAYAYLVFLKPRSEAE
jgi:hypothetical protein